MVSSHRAVGKADPAFGRASCAALLPVMRKELVNLSVDDVGDF